MIQHYTNYEIYGTLLHKNEDNTERIYFIVECLKYSFYRWMFIHNWNKVSERRCERNGIQGYKVTYKRNPMTNRLHR
jgi:hypothetical protein